MCGVSAAWALYLFSSRWPLVIYKDKTDPRISTTQLPANLAGYCHPNLAQPRQPPANSAGY